MGAESNPKVAVPQNPLDAMLANFISGVSGGNTTTTSPGNTAPLEQTLASLRGQDPSALLQSIFQQAGGQIPGLQVALSNAIGARSGGNSAVSQALQKLLQQTTLAGQAQLATQQAQNLATQVQAGTGIAQATQGATKRTGASSDESLRTLAILQALSKTGVLEKLGLGSKAGKDGEKAPGAQAPVTTAIPTELPGMQPSGAITSPVSPQGAFDAQPLESAAPIDFSQYDFSHYLQQTAADAGNYGGNISTPEQAASFDQEWDAGMGTAPQPAQPDSFEADWNQVWNEYNMPEYADGGLVTPKGRKGQKMKMEPEEGGSEAAEDIQEAKSNARFDTGFTANKQMDTFAALVAKELLAGSQSKKPEHGYADGGVVRAGGSRRGLNPSVEMFKPQGMQAVGGGVGGAIQRAASTSSDAGNLLSGDFMQRRVREAVGSMLGETAGELGQIASLGSSVNSLSRSLSEDKTPAIDLGGNEKYLGDAAALLSARSPEDLAWYGASKAAGPYGQYAGAARALTEGNMPRATRSAINAGLYAIPVYGQALGAVNSLSSLLGGPDIGERMVTWFGDPVSHIGDVVEEGVGNVAKTAGELVSDPIGTVSDTVSHWGNVVSNFFGGFGWKEGGHIQGPGTGTSDSIPAKLSDGEYVIPADVVDKLGVDFFERIRNQFHTPVKS